MQALQLTTQKIFLAVSAVFIVVEIILLDLEITFFICLATSSTLVCSFGGGDGVGLEHSCFPSERGLSSSWHHWGIFSPCQPKSQMEAEGAIPRTKERSNIIFTGKDFFVASVTSTRNFVLHTATGVLGHTN